MVTISDLVLNIERRNDPDRQSRRKATVTFTINFGHYERLANALFKVEVGMLTDDSAAVLPIASTIVQASQPSIQKTVWRNFTRFPLDSDRDYYHTSDGPVILEKADAWQAKVTVKPYTFTTVEAYSLFDIGSWGNEGDD